MAYSLRRAMQKIMGEDKSYLHYYNRIIKDYERGCWDFDVRTLIKKMYMEIPCSYSFSDKGRRKIFCLGIVDFKEFKKQYEKYLNEYLYPWQEIRKNKIIMRKMWLKKYGYISKGNQYCQAAQYKCSECSNSQACNVTKKYTNDEPTMKKITYIFELLYGNFQKGHYARLIKE